MNRFVKSTWFKILIGILVLLFAFIIFAVATRNGSSPLSSVTGFIEKPVARVSTVLGHGFSKVGNFFKSKSAYETEIKELEDEILTLQSELVDYENLKSTNKLYEDALGVKEENPDFEFVSATVIGRDAADVYTSFTLDKGTLSDVAVNDPVMCGEGQLVGLVTKVAPTYCVVSTILDPNVSVSAYEIRTRESGYIQNSTSLSSKGVTKLSGLNNSTSIAVGGIVCTSGVGGIYPRDLIIGTVSEVKDSENDISAYAVVTPSVDIKDIENVLIITSFEGQGVTGS